MSTVRKLEVLFLMILILCLVFMGWRNHALENKVGELEIQQAPLVGNAKAAQVKSAAIQDIYTERDKSNALLHQALEANPEYSGAAVPDAVAARLRAPDGSAVRVP